MNSVSVSLLLAADLINSDGSESHQSCWGLTLSSSAGPEDAGSTPKRALRVTRSISLWHKNVYQLETERGGAPAKYWDLLRRRKKYHWQHWSWQKISVLQAKHCWFDVLNNYYMKFTSLWWICGLQLLLYKVINEPESKPKTSICNLQPDEISLRLKNVNDFHFDDQVWKIQEYFFDSNRTKHKAPVTSGLKLQVVMSQVTLIPLAGRLQITFWPSLKGGGGGDVLHLSFLKNF